MPRCEDAGFDSQIELLCKLLPYFGTKSFSVFLDPDFSLTVFVKSSIKLHISVPPLLPSRSSNDKPPLMFQAFSLSPRCRVPSQRFHILSKGA